MDVPKQMSGFYTLELAWQYDFQETLVLAHRQQDAPPLRQYFGRPMMLGNASTWYDQTFHVSLINTFYFSQMLWPQNTIRFLTWNQELMPTTGVTS